MKTIHAGRVELFSASDFATALPSTRRRPPRGALADVSGVTAGEPAQSPPRAGHSSLGAAESEPAR